MRRKTHATFVAPSGPPSGPFLPVEGELYWVDTLLYSASDPAPRRPAVVFNVPDPPHSPIQIVTRTTDLQVRGVRHDAQPHFDLDEGVFSDLANVRKEAWCAPRVSRIGLLDADTMNTVRGRFS